MLESYKLMDMRGNYIGDLGKNSETKEYSFTPNPKWTGLLPVAFYGAPTQNRQDVVRSKLIDNWIRSRVAPRNRDGIESILKRMNLHEYDEWEILKKNWGFSPTDFYWLDMKGDTSIEEFKQILINSTVQIK